jgi:hypothetical protein
MSMDEIALCNRYAYEASFLPVAVKDKIWDKYFQK